jgi:hypothetical protein
MRRFCFLRLNMTLDLREDSARTQTNLVGHCKVCKTQWQIKSPSKADAKGCSFCDAPESAITVTSEEP